MSARFGCPSFPCVALAMVALLAAEAAADDITGRVVDISGKPLSDATVQISTAAPKVGAAIYCPSCYADCGKQARTDADGAFTIRSVDPSLVFHLVAAAQGHRAGNSGRIDPSQNKAKFQLAPLPKDLQPKQAIRGRVVDQDGKPVVGAVVSPFGCQRGDERWWGSLPGVDAFSITNDKGEFLISADALAEAFDLEVKSPRHAAKRFALVETGEKVHQLAVEIGSFVRGQLMADGAPVEGALIGLVQTDRSSESFLGEQQIGTRSDGTFEFSYIPDGNDFYLYTKMTSSAAGAGSLPLRRVTIEDGQQNIELGELTLEPVHTITGRVELTDGKPIPGPFQLLISRDGAWDSQTAMVESDGKFRFENVPGSEPFTFSARIPGYRLSADKNYHQLLNDTSLALYVERSRDDLVIYFEPVEDAKK